jgi:O-acetyl-ADP-ribose deacetylase (regulator of RNase III)
MHVDAIVNTANPKPVVGRGTDNMIHKKAGPELRKARTEIGCISVGFAAITPAFELPAKYVIHAVGPVWMGGHQREEELLRNCYDNALRLALENDCQSVAFPLISAGNYGFPKDKALKIAISAFSAFLLDHEMQIYLVVFNQDAYKLSEKLFRHVASYIDQNYVDACELETYGVAEQIRVSRNRYDWECASACKESIALADEPIPPKMVVGTSLDKFLKKMDIGFSEALLQLIDKTGKKDSEIYKKANISKQHFSKIRNNPDYKPTKSTAIALALALELDLEQTKALIGRAGYALTNSSKFDLIIQFFIQQRNYNIVEINIALYEFDQALLGTN